MRAKINLDQANTNKTILTSHYQFGSIYVGGTSLQSSNLAVRFRGREGLGEGEFIYFY